MHSSFGYAVPGTILSTHRPATFFIGGSLNPTDHSTRIMWCFFYAPHRLPRSYLKWISRLAYLDERIPEALRLIRNKQWSYINGAPQNQNPALLHEYVRDLGYPASWGDLNDLPAYGGPIANAAWKKLGITNRPGVGGLPCEVVHGPIGKSLGLQSSCHANAALRGIRAFGQALFIYVPVSCVSFLVWMGSERASVSGVCSVA
jgi:hypothetical protein